MGFQHPNTTREEGKRGSYCDAKLEVMLSTLTTGTLKCEAATPDDEEEMRIPQTCGTPLLPYTVVGCESLALGAFADFFATYHLR